MTVLVRRIGGLLVVGCIGARQQTIMTRAQSGGGGTAILRNHSERIARPFCVLPLLLLRSLALPLFHHPPPPLYFTPLARPHTCHTFFLSSKSSSRTTPCPVPPQTLCVPRAAPSCNLGILTPQPYTDQEEACHRRRWYVGVTGLFPIRSDLSSGPGACGKTSLLCSFALGEFPKEYVRSATFPRDSLC